MYQDISRLVATCIDKETLCLLEAYGSGSSLAINLIGDTPFTKAIETKLQKLNIRTRTTPDFWDAPFVVDVEMENPPKCIMTTTTAKNDIDCVYSSEWTDLSADGAACLQALTALTEFKYSHVAVVGRGHAVKGLLKALIANDYTVTQCHSYTKDVKQAIRNADVLIWTAPDWPFLASAFPMSIKLMLDVSYKIPRGFQPEKTMRIGNITTSILINRAMFCYFGGKSVKRRCEG